MSEPRSRRSHKTAPITRKWQRYPSPLSIKLYYNIRKEIKELKGRLKFKLDLKQHFFCVELE